MRARRPVCLAAALAVSSVGLVHTASASPAGHSNLLSSAVPVAEDAFADAAWPTRRTGDMEKVVASTTDTTVKGAYLKFALPAAPAGSTLTHAVLVAPAERWTGEPVALHTVTSAWSQDSLDAESAPAYGPALATDAPVGDDSSRAVFDVTGLVQAGAVQSFVLTADTGTAAFRSRESGHGAELRLTWVRQVQTTGVTTPVLTGSGPVVPTPAPTPPSPAPTPPTPPTHGGGTLFGMSADPRTGESAEGAVSRLTAQFGSLPVVRVYSPGPVPAHWDDQATLKALGSSSAVVYSFKADPTAVAAGAYDDRLRGFLAGRPAGLKVWVAFYHEPEDDITAGRFTAAAFRAATTHLAPVVRGAGGVPTTILMQYTLNPMAHLDWHDYYSPAVDVLAWDAYNTSARKSDPSYRDAAGVVGPVLAVAHETGKAFGWAELGSPCLPTDPDCRGRADWLTSLQSAFRTSGAAFATYWNRPDFNGGFDFSLNDTPSVTAWRAGFSH